jgi:hypothetical protein
VLQASSDPDTITDYGADLDVALDPAVESAAEAGLRAIVDAAAGRSVPKTAAVGNVGFQLTRGLLGASM